MNRKIYIRPETTNVAVMDSLQLLAGIGSIPIDNDDDVPGEEGLAKESNFDDFEDTDLTNVDYSSPSAWQ